jgi:hypothetical protein
LVVPVSVISNPCCYFDGGGGDINGARTVSVAGKAVSDVTIPWNQFTLTRAAAASVPTAPADDGESLGSMFDLPDDISFSGGGDMGGDENEGVEEDAGVEGADLAAITSVFNCDYIKQKKLNDKDGWECGWCVVR